MNENKKERRRSAGDFLYTVLAGTLSICLSVLFFFFLYWLPEISKLLKSLLSIMSPFIIGAVIAYLLSPICNRYEEALRNILPGKIKNAAEKLAVTFSVMTGVAITYLVVIMILPDLGQSIATLMSSLPGKITQAIRWIEHNVEDNPALVNYIESIYKSAQSSVESWTKETLTPSLTILIGGVGGQVINALSGVKNTAIGIVVAIYILNSRKQFRKSLKAILYLLIPEKQADWIAKEIRYADKMFNGFIGGKFIDSGIVAIICYVVCLLAKFPNPLLISAVIGITNIIPFFGPFIGAIPTTLLVLVEDPTKAIWFVAFILALQQVDGNIIGPKILGNSTGLSSFWVLFAIILFGGMWGFVGMIVGVPIMAVISDIFNQIVGSHLNWDAEVET